MSRVSDIIEKFINELMLESEGHIEIQRNGLANYFNCAPSQINYVLTTRFTSDRGYYIESRRGGGGNIKISRIEVDKNEYLSNILDNRIRNSVNKEGALEFIDILFSQKLISEKTSRIMKAAVDDSTLSMLNKGMRDTIRAVILKALIVAAFLKED